MSNTHRTTHMSSFEFVRVCSSLFEFVRVYLVYVMLNYNRVLTIIMTLFKQAFCNKLRFRV